MIKKLDVIEGLRYDYENKKLDVEVEYQKDGEADFVTQSRYIEPENGKDNLNDICSI